MQGWGAGLIFLSAHPKSRQDSVINLLHTVSLARKFLQRSPAALVQKLQTGHIKDFGDGLQEKRIDQRNMASKFTPFIIAKSAINTQI